MSTTYQLVQDCADPSTGFRFDDPLDPSLSTGTRNIRWLTIPTFWGALKNVVTWCSSISQNVSNSDVCYSFGPKCQLYVLTKPHL
jgi:hypothetical protein